MTARANETGWPYHRHPSMEVCEDFACIYPGSDDARPVVVLDVADAREKIARALREADDAALVRTNFDQICASYDEQADAVFAALGASDPSGTSDGEVS